MVVPRWWRCAPILFAAIVLGCSADPHQTYPISGSVSFHGQPVDHGTIDFFRPAEPLRRVAGGMIHEGQYDIPAEFGLTPGEYLVRLHSAESLANPGPDNMAGGFPINRERIPADFNVNTRLKTEIQPSANTFDIQIP